MTSETNLFYEEDLAFSRAAGDALAKAKAEGPYVSYFDGKRKESPSPFLPGTKVQFAWDSTSLGWLKVCPRLYQYSMIDGWRSRGESVHLTFGKEYHAALETYDKFRVQAHDHDSALREALRAALVSTWDFETGSPWSPDFPTKNRETLIRSIIWYLEQFRDDPAATVILANGRPAVELSFRMELDWGPKDQMYMNPGSNNQPYLLCGHLDRVVEFGGQKYVMDRKTTGSSLTPHYFDGFAPDNQMSIYTIAARVQFSTPVAGVIIDAAQIAVGFTRFQRGFTYRTEAQLEEWMTDFRLWTAQAEAFAEAGYWPQNDKACGLYGGCTFRKVCSKSPEVREKFLESDFERRPWNPLQSR